MQGAYGRIRGLGAEVVVVSFAPPGRLPEYRARHGWPFPVVADPDRAAYRAFGLGAARRRDLLRPRVLARYLGLMARGYRARRSGEDVHQLGGDFVLDAARRVVYAHRSADPADRPPAADLIAALEALRPAPGGGSA